MSNKIYSLRSDTTRRFTSRARTIGERMRERIAPHEQRAFWANLPH